METRKVRFINYLAYGSNDLLGAGSMAIVSTWILFFYTTFCGLTASQAALIFSISRLCDAVFSPIVGHLSDNLGHTWIGRRFGRRRFFLLAAIPLLPSFALMWVTGQSFWYYLGTYLLFELVYAAELIPYETLAAEMSPDYKARAKFAGARILFGNFSAILAGFLPGRIIEALGKDSANTFLYLGIGSAITFMLMCVFVYACTWERPRDRLPPPGETKGLAATFKDLYANLWSTVRIRAFRLHLGMYLGGYVSQDVFNAAFTYFVVAALAGATTAASNLTGSMFAAQFVGVALFIPLLIRIQPAPSYRIAASFFAAAVLVLLGVHLAKPAAASMMVLGAVLVAGLGRGGLNYIPWSTYNYMADVDEIVTGKRREGAFAGVMTFVRKTAQAGAVMVVGMLLDWGGLVKGAKVQSAHTLDIIAAILVAGPLLLLAFGVLVSLRFRLNSATHEVLMGEIEHLRGGARTPTSAEAKAVVEDLTGWPYDKLWGRNPVAGRGPSPMPVQPDTV